MKIQFTPEQLEDFVRCSSDPEYFISQYIKLKHDPSTIESMHTNRFVLDRSLNLNGLLYIIHQCCFGFGKCEHAAVLGPSLVASKVLLALVYPIIKSLPDHLRPNVVKSNKTEIEFENGCSISAYGLSSDSTCGQSFSLIYVDSYSTVKPEIADDFWNSIYPTVSSGSKTKCFISEGVNPFSRLYNDPHVQFVKL